MILVVVAFLSRDICRDRSYSLALVGPLDSLVFSEDADKYETQIITFSIKYFYAINNIILLIYIVSLMKEKSRNSESDNKIF